MQINPPTARTNASAGEMMETLKRTYQTKHQHQELDWLIRLLGEHRVCHGISCKNIRLLLNRDRKVRQEIIIFLELFCVISADISLRKPFGRPDEQCTGENNSSIYVETFLFDIGRIIQAIIRYCRPAGILIQEFLRTAQSPTASIHTSRRSP
jgi:hypothetical protein